MSNDGEKWEKREFVEHANDDEMEYFMCKDYPEDKPYLFWWKFARPIDKIEPELPNVPDYKTMFDHSIANPIDVQVEHLTTFCQALARQKSTK